MREELTLCRETVESGGFLDLLYGGNSGQHEEWISTADLLVQCQEASSVESQRLKPGELLSFLQKVRDTLLQADPIAPTSYGLQTTLSPNWRNVRSLSNQVSGGFVVVSFHVRRVVHLPAIVVEA